MRLGSLPARLLATQASSPSSAALLQRRRCSSSHAAASTATATPPPAHSRAAAAAAAAAYVHKTPAQHVKGSVAAAARKAASLHALLQRDNASDKEAQAADLRSAARLVSEVAGHLDVVDRALDGRQDEAAASAAARVTDATALQAVLAEKRREVVGVDVVHGDACRSTHSVPHAELMATLRKGSHPYRVREAGAISTVLGVNAAKKAHAAAQGHLDGYEPFDPPYSFAAASVGERPVEYVSETSLASMGRRVLAFHSNFFGTNPHGPDAVARVAAAASARELAQLLPVCRARGFSDVVVLEGEDERGLFSSEEVLRWTCGESERVGVHKVPALRGLVDAMAKKYLVVGVTDTLPPSREGAPYGALISNLTNVVLPANKEMLVLAGGKGGLPRRLLERCDLIVHASLGRGGGGEGEEGEGTGQSRYFTEGNLPPACGLPPASAVAVAISAVPQ